MRKALSILALTVVTLTVAAQSPAKDTLDYGMRFGEVNMAYAKSPEAVDALFDMAMLYFDNSQPMRNLPLAMRYAKRAELNYLKLMQDNKHSELTRLVHRGIVLATVSKLKESVRNAALNNLSNHNDIDKEILESYLDEFADDAEIVTLVRQRRLKQMYETDMLAATPQSYYHIIETYPQTTEAEKAEAMLGKVAVRLFEGISDAAEIDSVAALYPASPSVARAAERKKSRLAFTHATEQNTIAAYKAFLRQYPSSDESQQVRDIIDNLVAMQYNTLHTAKEYADFADSNADNALADKALAQIRRIIKENRDVQAARLYLKRFSLDPHYNEVYATYYSWYAEEGNGELLTKFEEENPNSPLKYALERDMERAMIIDNIDLMEPYIEDDFPTYSRHIHQTMGKKFSFVPLQRMLQQLTAAGDYQTAASRMGQYEICFDDVQHDEFVELQELLSAPRQNLKEKQFTVSGDVLNPCLNTSDNRLYFTRVTETSNGEASKSKSLEICYATAKWESCEKVAFANNPNTNLSLFGFFDGGEKMLLGSDGDIWIAERDGNEWRVSDILPYPVNTDYIETDALMLPDGSGLLLASDRPGGQNLQQSGSYFHGDTSLATDLYFIPVRNSIWGNAVNLGTTINTPYCERSPIVSKDLRTLYFITDSRGMGYGDIYTATRTSIEDWTSWTKPQNMGYEVNSSFSEASVSLSPEEHRLLVSTNASGHYICRAITLNNKPVATNNNYKLDVLGMDGQAFRVRVADISKQTVTQVVDYLGNGAEINIDLHKDKRYAIFGDATEYFVPAIIVGPGSTPQHIRGYSYSTLVAMDKAVPLKAVKFDQNSALTPVAQIQLEQLAQFLKKTPNAVAEIDIDVAELDNTLAYSLSLERGNIVKKQLVAMGVEDNRIIISAYGNANTKHGTPEGVSIQFR